MKKMKLQLTDGSVWTVDYMSNGKVKFLGLLVDIKVADNTVTLIVNGTEALMQHCTRVSFKDYFLNGETRVTGMMIDDANVVVNILPYDLYIMQPDGTFYMLPSNKFSSANLPSPCDGVKFIGSMLHFRVAREAGREDIIPRLLFGRTEGRKDIVWPTSEQSEADSWPVPYFIE